MSELEKIMTGADVPRRDPQHDPGKMFLYIKISPKGLFYLGKFSNKSYNTQTVYHYVGSGLYWLRHLKHHKYTYKDIKTIVLHETWDEVELKTLGLYYSKLWDVVNSEIWANLVFEQGEGSPGQVVSIERRETIRQFCIANKTHLRLQTPESRAKAVKNSIVTDKQRLNAKVNLNTTEAIQKRKLTTNYKDPERLRKIKENTDFLKKSQATFKPILQYDKEGKFIKEWPSIASAATALKLSKGTLSYVCDSDRMYKKFIWKYKTSNNYLLEIEPLHNNKPRTNNKPIIQYSLDMKEIQVWFNSKQAAAKLKLSLSGIIGCCKKRYSTYGNYIWSYYNIS